MSKNILTTGYLLTAVYILIDVLAIAWVLIGLFTGRRWVGWFLWSLGLLFFLVASALAIWQWFGTPVAGTFVLLCVSFALGYLWPGIKGLASIISARIHELLTQQPADRRKSLEIETLRRIESLKLGATHVVVVTFQEFDLLKPLVARLRTQGWRVDVEHRIAESFPNLDFHWFVSMTTPESPQQFRESLKQLRSLFGS